MTVPLYRYTNYIITCSKVDTKTTAQWNATKLKLSSPWNGRLPLNIVPTHLLLSLQWLDGFGRRQRRQLNEFVTRFFGCRSLKSYVNLASIAIELREVFESDTKLQLIKSLFHKLDGSYIRDFVLNILKNPHFGLKIGHEVTFSKIHRPIVVLEGDSQLFIYEKPQ